MENLEVKKGYFILFWHDLYGGLNWYGPYKSQPLAKKESLKYDHSIYPRDVVIIEEHEYVIKNNHVFPLWEEYSGISLVKHEIQKPSKKKVERTLKNKHPNYQTISKKAIDSFNDKSDWSLAAIV